MYITNLGVLRRDGADLQHAEPYLHDCERGATAGKFHGRIERPSIPGARESVRMGGNGQRSGRVARNTISVLSCIYCGISKAEPSQIVLLCIN